jgi:hypothetical protein
MVHTMSYVPKPTYDLNTIQHAVPKFWVVGVVSNPVRYDSRYNLFNIWKERLLRAPGVNLFVVEVQQGEREFAVTEKENHCHLQIRTTNELWIKENMINLAIQRIVTDVGESVAKVKPEYVAWVDCDVIFSHETTWHYETLHQLQTYDLVQMWETAVDLGPTGQIISEKPHQSFMSCYRRHGIDAYSHGNPQKLNAYYGPYGDTKKNVPYFHPGFAWAAKLSKLSKVGCLIDRCIIGAGDHHMALASVGHAKRSVPEDFGKASPYYLEMVLDWERKALREFQGRVGYVNGTLLHMWHGKKKQRNYWGRWDVVRPKNGESAYDPYLDVFADGQGLLQLDDDKPKMRDMIHDYFRARNEDSIDLE